jgi:hypothetical protein
MATEVTIICESCGSFHNLPVAEVIITPDMDRVSFSYVCASCGSSFSHEDTPLADALKLLDGRDEITVLAESLGLTREQYTSYVYPPDVMATVDLERRKIRSQAVKLALRDARQKYPERTDDGWWIVYRLLSLDAAVDYNRDTRCYRLHKIGVLATHCADAIELGSRVAEVLAPTT